MYTNYKGPLTPQFDEGILQAVWKTTDQVPKLMENSYENIKILFRDLAL